MRAVIPLISHPQIPRSSGFGRGPGTFQPWQVNRMLELADERAKALPPGPKRDGLLDRIHRHQKALEALNPFGRMFERFFDPLGGEDDEDEW